MEQVRRAVVAFEEHHCSIDGMNSKKKSVPQWLYIVKALGFKGLKSIQHGLLRSVYTGQLTFFFL